MIDTLVRLRPKAEARWPLLRRRIGADGHILVTLHRPSNVDDPATLSRIIKALDEIRGDTVIVFPVHPRTRQRIQELAVSGFDIECANLRLIDPLGYLDFLALEMNARLVLTDSGGIQEETTFLRVPCLTVRSNTERPITITAGTNRLVPTDSIELRASIVKALCERSSGEIPALWEGKAAERIVGHLQRT